MSIWILDLTYQSLSNIQHWIVFDTNTRKDSPVSREEGDEEEEKESFQHIQHFFITVRCLDFKEAWSYTYTRIRTCLVFSVHCSEQWIFLHWKYTNIEWKENTDHNECKGKGISMKVIALWAFWAPRKSRRNDEWKRRHDKTSNNSKRFKDENDDYVVLCMLYVVCAIRTGVWNLFIYLSVGSMLR